MQHPRYSLTRFDATVPCACARRDAACCRQVEPGDVLRIEHATADRIQPGDVILYDAGGRLIAHRFVRSAFDNGIVHLITRGDSHWWTDPPIASAQLLGRVIGIRRCTMAGHVRGAVMRVWRSLRERATSRAALAPNPAGAR